MPINSIRDNENNRWNKNAKKRPEQQKNKQSRKRTRRGEGERGTETVVKRWELNDFVVLNAQLAFLQLICKAS